MFCINSTREKSGTGNLPGPTPALSQLDQFLPVWAPYLRWSRATVITFGLLAHIHFSAHFDCLFHVVLQTLAVSHIINTVNPVLCHAHEGHHPKPFHMTVHLWWMWEGRPVLRQIYVAKIRIAARNVTTLHCTGYHRCSLDVHSQSACRP